MKKIVLQTIQEITSEKKELNKVPNFALLIEINNRIWKKTDMALQELEKDKTIKTGNTVNNTFYALAEPLPDNQETSKHLSV